MLQYSSHELVSNLVLANNTLDFILHLTQRTLFRPPLYAPTTTRATTSDPQRAHYTQNAVALAKFPPVNPSEDGLRLISTSQHTCAHRYQSYAFRKMPIGCH